MYENNKIARQNDNLESSLIIHHLTEEKNKLEATYDKLVQDVHELMNFQEDRVLDLSYLQDKRAEVVSDMNAEMANKEAVNYKLKGKYEVLVNLTEAQAKVIQNLKLNHMKEKERVNEERRNCSLRMHNLVSVRRSSLKRRYS